MNISDFFFDGWTPILRTILIGLASYVSLIAMLRISGKRTLSKMNMFDWVVSVAMGSVMASALVSKTVSYSQALTAFATLIGGQFVVTWLSVRSEAVANLVKADPTILYYKGRFYEAAMRRERVPHEEILSAIRQSGQGAPSEIAAVLLESSGELIVMNEVDADQTVTLEQANNWKEVQGLA